MSPRKAAPKADASLAPVPESVEKPAPKRAPRAKRPAPEPVVEPVAETPAPEAPKPAARKRKAAPAPEAAPALSETSVVQVSAKEPGAADAYVPAVLQAIREGRAIELIFLDADANPPRTFEARQLIFDVFTQAWFIWGWDRRYNAERHHRLDALAEVNLVEGQGRAAQGPFPEGTPANQIGGWRGGEPIAVKVQLQKQWVFAVRQAPAPFPDFRMEEMEDGRALVSFTATDLRAIARWVMQFGDGITVQEPQRLLDRVRQVAQAWGAKLVPTPAPKAEPVVREEPRAKSRPQPKSELRPEPSHRSEPHHRSERKETSVEAPSKGARIETRIDRL